MTDGEVEEAVRTHMAQVYYWSWRLSLSQPWERPDLQAAGYVGLVEAVRTYDPEHGTTLSTWVGVKVQSAMRDYLRQRYGRHSRKIESRAVSLEALEAGGFSPSTSGWEVEVEDRVDARAAVERIFSAMEAHPRRFRANHRYVLERRLEGATLRQVGDELGVTESRASQIEGEAIGRLQAIVQLHRLAA